MWFKKSRSSALEPFLLAPFGAFGRRFRYDPALAPRYRFFSTFVLWLGVACATYLLLRYYQHKLDAGEVVEAFVLNAVSLDLVRIVGLRLIFRRARPWSGDDVDRSPLGGQPILGGAGMMTTGGLVVAWAVLDMLMFALAWGSFVLSVPHAATSIFILCFFHVLAYASAAGNEWWRRRN
jgi:hypothetical protein